MQICCKLSVRALAVILLAACVASQELNSTLYSTISGAPVAFENENVVFTCVARGSNHMGWSSDEYIGTGGRRLEFISTNAPGTNRTSGEARAELISASVDQFIISRLYINIQSTILAATVHCQNIGAGTETSLPFKLADNGLSVTCDKQSVCPGETVTCVCATGGSDTLAWDIDGSRVAFPSTDPLLTRRNVTGLSAYGILTDRYNRNGIGVITSNLTVTGSMSGTSLLIRCENVDRSTSSPTIISSSQNCLDPGETTSPSRTEPAPSTANDRTPIVAVGIICALLILLLLAAIVIVLIMAFIDLKKKKREITRLEGEAKSLEGKIIEKTEEVSNLEIKNEGLNNTIAEQKDKITGLTTAKIGLEEIVKEKDSELDKLSIEIDSLKTNQQANKENEKKIKKLEKEKRGLETKLREKDSKIQELAQKKSGLEMQVQQKDSQITTLTEHLREARESVHNGSGSTRTGSHFSSNPGPHRSHGNGPGTGTSGGHPHKHH